MPARIPLDDAALVHQYTVEKLSMSDIATLAGCGKNTVRSRLLSAGVEPERRDRISRTAQGRSSPRKGVKCSPETCRKISLAKLGNRYCVGRILSVESRAKMSAVLRGRTRYAPGVAALIESQRQKFKRLLTSLLRAAKTKKRGRTANALGYSRQALVAHIEAQFLPGMSWAARDSFSIDHRVPVIEFIRRGITDPKIVSSLANLQPMVPRANREKSGKYSGDFAADLAAIMAFNAEIP